MSSNTTDTYASMSPKGRRNIVPMPQPFNPSLATINRDLNCSLVKPNNRCEHGGKPMKEKKEDSSGITEHFSVGIENRLTSRASLSRFSIHLQTCNALENSYLVPSTGLASPCRLASAIPTLIGQGNSDQCEEWIAALGCLSCLPCHRP